jgi:hypothetical protein
LQTGHPGTVGGQDFDAVDGVEEDAGGGDEIGGEVTDETFQTGPGFGGGVFETFFHGADFFDDG